MNELQFKLEIKRDAYEIYTSMHDLYVDYIIKVADDLYYKRASYIEDYELLKQLATFEDQMDSYKDGELDYILDYLLNGKRVIDWAEYSPVYENKNYYTLYTSPVEIDGYKKICLYFEDDDEVSERLVDDNKFDELMELIEMTKDVDEFSYLHDEISELIEP